jgi:hypothetical protein
MEKATFEALQKIMSAIGEIQDGETYLHDPFARDPAMFDAYEEIVRWMDNQPQIAPK